MASNVSAEATLPKIRVKTFKKAHGNGNGKDPSYPLTTDPDTPLKQPAGEV
jgi:hypothetical protein